MAVFELAACRQCGASYIVGERTPAADGEGTTLRQPGRRFLENPSNLDYFLVTEEREPLVPGDEDDDLWLDGESDDTSPESHMVCAACGAIARRDQVDPLCTCRDAVRIPVQHVPSKQGLVHACPACGKRSPSGLVWRFLPGNEAAASVLATALYQSLPASRAFSDTPRSTTTTASPIEWASTAPDVDPDQQSSGRRLLVFADSRQDAAFFAPYLERSYNRLLRRRLIYVTLEEHRSAAREQQWRVNDLVQPVVDSARRLKLFAGMSRREQLTQGWSWVLFELLALDRRNSLEGTGCMAFTVARPETWQPPMPLLEWGLTEDEAWLVFQALLDTFRSHSAIAFPDEVSPADDLFAPRNRECWFRMCGPSRSKGIHAWCPSSSSALNSRLDYLQRLLDRLGRLPSDAPAALRGLWMGLDLDNPSSCWHPLFTSTHHAGEGVAYQARTKLWDVHHAADVAWYRCSKCNSLASFNLRGVCPTYRCSGQLRPAAPEQDREHDHYRRLYQTMAPLPMTAEEHTAQLTSEAAAERQAQFVSGEVNVLSCSTTFELGVDVGQLESVFLRNFPPTPANYAQRAGRAGRRTGATAFALTYGGRNPHDLSHFQDPDRILSGTIRPPHFSLSNEKIARRHVHAVALAAFWREHPETFRTVEAFCLDTDGVDRVRRFLGAKPEHVRRSLERTIPADLLEPLGIPTWTWVSGLVEGGGILAQAAQEVKGDIDSLEAERQRRYTSNQPSDFIRHMSNTIRRRQLLGFLAARGVIPKYGFPTDVVELQLLHHGDEARRLQLQRDLRIALAEYAPDAQVVADGRVWTSRFLKLLPDRAWVRFRYAVCDHCQHFHRELADTPETQRECVACGLPLGGTRNRGEYVIPEFGFLSEHAAPGRPRETRPARTMTTRVHFSGEGHREESVRLPLPGLELTAVPSRDGELVIINHAGYRGFLICSRCGFACRTEKVRPRSHHGPWGGECRGKLERLFLGHQLRTDVLELRFDGLTRNEPGFWLSLLYALLDGASTALDIERSDLDGCLHAASGDPRAPTLVLFDAVPGGAGHVRRVAQRLENLRDMLVAARARLERCDCGGEKGDTSCYGCLRRYDNQYCHDELRRGPVIEFLRATGL